MQSITPHNREEPLSSNKTDGRLALESLGLLPLQTPLVELNARRRFLGFDLSDLVKVGAKAKEPSELRDPLLFDRLEVLALNKSAIAL